MMGRKDFQPSMYSAMSLEDCVPADDPFRRIRGLIDTEEVRRLCKPLYSEEGRPSVPPEQLFLALLGGYFLGLFSQDSGTNWPFLASE